MTSYSVLKKFSFHHQIHFNIWFVSSDFKSVEHKQSWTILKLAVAAKYSCTLLKDGRAGTLAALVVNKMMCDIKNFYIS